MASLVRRIASWIGAAVPAMTMMMMMMMLKPAAVVVASLDR